ncbi:MAG TPA: hypothetical protein VMV44_10110 [Rectinemataceae bacterium]|nr:hypothetical protein [Rectinemataceae bacterium]
MSHMIHYRDDLFLLSTQIKALDAMLAVDADADFFRDRAFGDILFIDSTIKTIAGILAKNVHLVDRNDYLRLLERLSLDFVSTLERVESGRSPLGQALEAHSQRILSIAMEHRDLAADLDGSLSERETAEATDSSIVSGDELQKLLGEGLL